MIWSGVKPWGGADPEFDGEPVQIHEPAAGDPIAPPDVSPTDKEVAALREQLKAILGEALVR